MKDNYSEIGPVWQVCPIVRDEELGSMTKFLIVDLDYDTINYTGRCTAECNNEHDAELIKNLLNEDCD